MVSKRFEETDIDESITIGLSPSGGAVALPRSARRLGDEQIETLRELQLLGFQLHRTEAQADEVARECREVGISWSLIGWCLGLTGEAARLRYSDPS